MNTCDRPRHPVVETLGAVTLSLAVLFGAPACVFDDSAFSAPRDAATAGPADAAPRSAADAAEPGSDARAPGGDGGGKVADAAIGRDASSPADGAPALADAGGTDGPAVAPDAAVCGVPVDCSRAACDGRACGADQRLCGSVCDDGRCVPAEDGASCGNGCDCDGGRPRERACEDGADNDVDGEVDCRDADCPSCGALEMCCADGSCALIVIGCLGR